MSQGVVIPQSQLRDDNQRTTPNKVLRVVQANLVAVQYSDGAGIIHKEFWYEVDGKFYQPPDAERFAATIRPVKDVLSKQAELLLGSSHAPSAPTSDPVDVVSNLTASEVDV